jgi:hypothetical protein
VYARLDQNRGLSKSSHHTLPFAVAFLTLVYFDGPTMAAAYFLLACSVLVTASLITFSRKTFSTPLVSSQMSPQIHCTPPRRARLGDALDVVPQHLHVPLGSAFPKALVPLSSKVMQIPRHARILRNTGSTLKRRNAFFFFFSHTFFQMQSAVISVRNSSLF